MPITDPTQNNNTARYWISIAHASLPISITPIVITAGDSGVSPEDAEAAVQAFVDMIAVSPDFTLQGGSFTVVSEGSISPTDPEPAPEPDPEPGA